MLDSVYTDQNVYIFHLSKSFRAPQKSVIKGSGRSIARDQKARIANHTGPPVLSSPQSEPLWENDFS